MALNTLHFSEIKYLAKIILFSHYKTLYFYTQNPKSKLTLNQKP